jgi:membrane-bound lytic murein transglycosylase D
MDGDTKTQANRKSIFGIRSDLGIILFTSLALFLCYHENLKDIQWPEVNLELDFVPAVFTGATFPNYPSLQPHYRFWKDVYTRYSENQVILHDSINPRIIYEIINLDAPLGTGDHKSRRKVENARKRYRRILEGLSVEPYTRDIESRRVAQLFGNYPDIGTYQRAMGHIRIQPGLKESFHAGILRSNPYLKKITTILADQGLPEDLVYLAHVRSVFDYRARSGADSAGIWQLSRTRSAAMLNIGTAIDQRRDPILATTAAAAILKGNYSRLKSWPLAITAFCGYNTSALIRNRKVLGDQEEVLASISRSHAHYGYSRRNAYSMFLAAREVARNHHIYYPYRRGSRQPQTVRVRIDGFAHITDLSSHFAVAVETIARLNPALSEAAIMGCQLIPKGYLLNLPQRAGVDHIALARRFPSTNYKRDQKALAHYRVRKGDTVGELAARFGIPISSMITANNLGARATIYVDQKLILPFGAEAINTDIRGSRIRPIWMASKGR